MFGIPVLVHHSDGRKLFLSRTRSMKRSLIHLIAHIRNDAFARQQTKKKYDENWSENFFIMLLYRGYFFFLFFCSFFLQPWEAFHSDIQHLTTTISHTKAYARLPSYSCVYAYIRIFYYNFGSNQIYLNYNNNEKYFANRVIKIYLKQFCGSYNNFFRRVGALL